jgi:hypothetical protein
MAKKILHTAICFFFVLTAWAQNRINADAKGIIYNNEKAVDFRLHTHGWAVNFQKGLIKTYYKTRYYNFGIGELKHYKESRKSTDFNLSGPSQGFRSYTFGKQNYAFALRGGIGMKRYYSEKAAKNGVAVGISFEGGVTAALMKPYYLELRTTRDLQGRTIKYTPETANLFLDDTRITGKGALFKGLGESSIIPGIHARAGVHLDWGAFDEFLRALEVGIMLDVFPKKLPILVSEQNKPYFLNLFASFQIGKRD